MHPTQTQPIADQTAERAARTAQVPGVRLDAMTGQYVPTIDGKDASPTSFDEERALDIARQHVAFAQQQPVSGSGELLNILKHIAANPALPGDPFYLAQITAAIGRVEAAKPSRESTRDALALAKYVRRYRELPDDGAEQDYIATEADRRLSLTN